MTVVPVSVRQSSRRATTARASLVLCTALALAAVVLLVLTSLRFLQDPDVVRGLFALLSVAGTCFFGAYAVLAHRVWREAQQTRGGGTMTVADRTLVLDLPGVFAEPVVIAADELRAMAFDRRGLAVPSLTWLRFPVRSGGRAVGSLWRHGLPAPLPVAAAGPERPTVVLLFRTPRRFRSATGAGRVAEAAAVVAVGSQLADVTAPAHLPGARPVDPSHSYAGLFVAVDDVRAARRATADWPELRRVLRAEDAVGLPGLLPMPGPARTLAGTAVLGWLVITVGAAVAELAGSADLPLLALLVVPPTLALNAYVLVRATRAFTARAQRPERPARTAGRVGAFALALVAAALAVVQAFDLGSSPDPPVLPPGTPLVPGPAEQPAPFPVEPFPVDPPPLPDPTFDVPLSPVGPVGPSP